MPLCCPALRRTCGNHSGEAERSSGIGLKLFGFIPEPVFTFIPESCSGSSRNTVRNHAGIAFILLRIPHIAPVGAFSFATRPVKAGEVLLIYGVGFGPTVPHVAPGQVFSGSAPSPVLPQVTIGGVTAK